MIRFASRACLPLLLVAAACAPKDIAPTPAVGKAYFSQVGCVSCHRVGSEGSAVGPDLTAVGFRHTPEWLELYIRDPQAWKPDTLMPNRRLPDGAYKAIVAYLAEQKGQAWPKGGRPWDGIADTTAKGKSIYTRAGCASCHGLGGAGGYPNRHAKGGLIPALNKVSESYTKAELLKKIKTGVAAPQKADEKGPAPLIAMPAWGGLLNETELDAVATYLLSLTPGKGEKTDW